MNVTDSKHLNKKDNKGRSLLSENVNFIDMMKSLDKLSLDKKSVYMFGVVQIQNLPVIMFSSGQKVANDVVHNLKVLINTHFNIEMLHMYSLDSLIFICRCGSKQKTNFLVENLGKELNNLLILNNSSYIHIKSGVAYFKYNDDITVEFNKAYMALFECKSYDGCKFAVYTDIHNKMLQHENNLKLASYFQKAISEKRLRLAFQPIISSSNGKTVHMESLLRLITEDDRIITAGPFIPIAEVMGFIDQIDLIVLGLVVNELKLYPKIKLAMNISNLTIDDKIWFKHAKKLLSDTDIARRLIIEITETSMHREMSKVEKFVDNMKSLGCEIAIDDFGSGYTSFSQLKIIHADFIKIDGLFIRDIVDNHDNQLFVKTLIAFAKGFGIRTVAEFVENGEIAKALLDLKIDFMQGNYFSPAINYRTWADN